MQQTNNRKRYLIVGVNGAIGSALFARLSALGEAVWGTTLRHEAVSDSIFYLNLLDPVESWQFPDVQFDVVYLCAGICRMHLCDDDPVQTSKVNIDGMVRLASYLSDHGAFLIYLSTNQVFFGDRPFIEEGAKYAPLNEYGWQKSQAEQLIMSKCNQTAVVRLTKVVEPGMQLIASWIEKLKRRQHIEAFQDMMLAPVSLRLVLDVLVKLGVEPKAGYYHLSGQRDVSYYDVALYLAQLLGCDKTLITPVKAIEKGMKKTHVPQFTSMSCSSTIAYCGITPPDFNEVLSECFKI